MTSAGPSLTKEQLEELSQRCTERSEVGDLDTALAEVARLGVVSTFSTLGNLPRLSRLLSADADHQIVWQAQEEAPRRRIGFYGKVFAGKGTIIAGPVFAALAVAVGGLDHKVRYAEGRLSADANGIADHLATFGPVSGGRLRQDSGFGRKEQGKAFEGAMTELQQQLLITPVDQIPGNGKFKTPVWQLSKIWWPDVAELPTGIDAGQNRARRDVVAHLAQASGVFRDADFRSWLRPYGISPDPVIADLAAADEIIAIGRIGNSQVYVHDSKRGLIN